MQRISIFWSYAVNKNEHGFVHVNYTDLTNFLCQRHVDVICHYTVSLMHSFVISQILYRRIYKNNVVYNVVHQIYNSHNRINTWYYKVIYVLECKWHNPHVQHARHVQHVTINNLVLSQQITHYNS